MFRIPPNVSLNLTELSVCDRWGNKIFTTGDISKGWEVTYKGVKLSSAVFVYIVNGSNEKGTVFKKGTVLNTCLPIVFTQQSFLCWANTRIKHGDSMDKAWQSQGKSVQYASFLLLTCISNAYLQLAN